MQARASVATIERYRHAWRQGDARAAYELGRMHDPNLDGSQPNRKLAVAWYRRAARVGNVEAKRKLANLLWSSRSRKPRREYVTLCLELGTRAGADNLYNLALAFEDGVGTRRNLERALFWYRRSAALGDVDACLALGYMALNGQGTRRNYAAALRWYRKAGRNPSAQYSLGQIYLEGLGVPASAARARYHLRRAALQGHKRAIALLRRTLA